MNINSILNTVGWFTWFMPKDDAATVKQIISSVEQSETLLADLEPKAQQLVTELTPAVNLIIKNWPEIMKVWNIYQPAILSTIKTIDAHKKKGLTAPQAVQATVDHLNGAH